MYVSNAAACCSGVNVTPPAANDPQAPAAEPDAPAADGPETPAAPDAPAAATN